MIFSHYELKNKEMKQLGFLDKRLSFTSRCLGVVTDFCLPRPCSSHSWSHPSSSTPSLSSPSIKYDPSYNGRPVWRLDPSTQIVRSPLYPFSFYERPQGHAQLPSFPRGQPRADLKSPLRSQAFHSFQSTYLI